MGLTKSPNSAVHKVTKSPRKPTPAAPVVVPFIEPEPEAPASPLSALTNAELQEMADYEGIELPPRATKAEMVAAIEEAGVELATAN